MSPRGGLVAAGADILTPNCEMGSCECCHVQLTVLSIQTASSSSKKALSRNGQPSVAYFSHRAEILVGFCFEGQVS